MEGLLSEINQPQVYIQAYADDIVLLFQGKNVVEMHWNDSWCLESVGHWAKNHELNFSVEKSNDFVFTWRGGSGLRILLLNGYVIHKVNQLDTWCYS